MAKWKMEIKKIIYFKTNFENNKKLILFQFY